MPLILRDCQQDVIDDARVELRTHKNILIQAATGFGKTVLSAFMAGSANDKGKRLYFICHRSELIYQTHLTFNKVGIQHGFIAAGFTPEYHQRIQICSIDTLKRRFKDIPIPDICIWDECFPAGTLVDGAPIETIKSGDMVWSFNHNLGMIEKRKVIRLFKSKPKSMVLVKLSNGDEINCTSGHPFYIEGTGYIPAIELKDNDYVSKFQMPLVRDSCCRSNKIPEGQNTIKRQGLLQKGMWLCLQGFYFFKNNGRNKQKIRIKKNERKQPNEKQRFIGKDEGDIKKNRAQATYPWWKWRCYGRASEIITRINYILKPIVRICCKNWKAPFKWIAESLQNRYSVNSSNDCDRSRREKSRHFKKAGVGQKKRHLSTLIRVVSVEVLQSSSSGRYEEVCSDDYVYNIEIESNHNYFVSGILVHNCHHLGAKGWSDVHGFYDKAYHIGLSATPHRLDGKGLGKWFDKMVCGPSVRWLIDEGYLSDYKLISSPVEPDLSQVKTRMGDFKKDELNEAVDTNTLTGDIVKHYLKYARGKKAVLFAVSIKHSLHLVEQFKANGVMAVHLDGKTPKDERKIASRAFAEGHIDVLCNVGLFGEGYDLAAQSGMEVNIECVIDAAPTQSLSKCLQGWGRSLRPKPYPAIILDHAGNWKRHGLPDQDREWSLDGEDRKKKSASEDSITVKQCPECYHVHFPMKICPECGYVYKVEGREIKEEDGELVEIDKEQARVQARRDQGEANSLDKLIELGRTRGYKNPAKWAAHVYTARLAKQKQRGVAA